MASAKMIEHRNVSIGDLHPIMRPLAQGIVAATAKWHFEAGGQRCRFELFEGYRSPERQEHLFTRTKSTKARPWQSAHQYGLAVDFACFGVEERVWSWVNDAPWGSLKALAASFGLDVPIEWDRGHLQHPIFKELRRK